MKQILGKKLHDDILIAVQESIGMLSEEDDWIAVRTYPTYGIVFLNNQLWHWKRFTCVDEFFSRVIQIVFFSIDLHP